MKLIRIDGKDYEFGSEAHVNAAVAVEKSRADKAEARADAADAKVKDLETRLTEATDPKRLDECVAELASLRSKATAVMGADYKFDAKDDLTVMREVVAKARPSVKLDGKSADYVRAAFELVEAPAPTKTDRKDAADILDPKPPTSDREDANAEVDSEKARREMQKRNANAWKTPSGDK